MSSLPRRMQRAPARNLKSTFGSKLGVHNEKAPDLLARQVRTFRHSWDRGSLGEILATELRKRRFLTSKPSNGLVQ